MKRLSLLIALIAFVFGNAFAQMSYDFNDGVAGAKIAQTYGMPWTTWSNAPGGAEDGVFGEIGGSMAAHFTYGNDQILYLGDHETGVYDLEFDAYVPQGKNGYFNVLHHFDGVNSNNCIWAIQVYMHETNDGQNSTQAPGHGTVHAGSNGTADLPCVYDQWMHFRVHVDADTDVAQLWFNVEGDDPQMYAEWQWSLDSFGENTTNRILAAMDFFPPENTATSEFYVDNLVVSLQSNDEILRFEDFEAYEVGEYLAQQSIAMGQDYWTTWNNQPGTAEDGIIAVMGGSQCVQIAGTSVDQVFLLGDEENGNYDLEFDILVPEGKNGYFNILHRFAGGNSKWAMQCYLHLLNDGQNSTVAPGQGTIHAGSNGTATLENLVFDDWMHFRLNVDTDTDVANFYYTAPGEEEEFICTWQWSLDSFGSNVVGRTLAAMDFFVPMDDGSSEFYLDNFSFIKIGGESAPRLSINPMEVDIALPEDAIETVEIEIVNDGNSIGDWTGYIEFGQGGAGTDTQVLNYCDAANTPNGIGSSSAFTREMAIRLPATAYAGAAMGMKIANVEYLVQSSYPSSDDTYIFRVYGQGLHGQPGDMLAEKAITQTVTANTWITAQFDEDIYMTGQDIWVTVQLEQAANQYPLSMDQGNYGEIQDGNWLSTSGNAFSHCYQAPSASGDGFAGAWYIKVNCVGELIPATWVNIDKNEGSILGGNSEVVTMTFNTIAMGSGVYTASFNITTNDVELPFVEIPVTLRVGESIAETEASAFKVYPNPTTGMVTVEGDNIAAIAIYSAAGQLVRVVRDTTVDMSAFGTGVYFFNIIDSANNTTIQRVVVK